jgi:hypothetical protein
MLAVTYSESRRLSKVFRMNSLFADPRAGGKPVESGATESRLKGVAHAPACRVALLDAFPASKEVSA